MTLKPSANKIVLSACAALGLLVACADPPRPADAGAEADARPERVAAANPQAVITGERLPAEYDDSAIAYGAPDGAKVTIVEYVDFECKYCKKLSDTIDHIAAQHPDEIRVVFKQFPLPGHSRAMAAGAAALAAEAQGKGKAYRARLFKYRTRLSDAELDAYAEAVGVPDMNKFREDRSSPELRSQLERERSEAARVGVNAPPFAFVNGRAIPSVPSLDELSALIDEELALAERVLEAGADQAELYDHYMRYARASWVEPSAAAPAPDDQAQTRNPQADEHYAVFVDGSAATGRDDALVTLIAFMDLSSPAPGQGPAQLGATLAAVRERAPDLRVVFRHVVARDAKRQVLARAGLVALSHDKFWPWFEALAQTDTSKPEAAALAAAAAAGLDAAELRAQLDSGPVTAKLARDELTATSLGLDRTPGYFVNGRYLSIDATVEAIVAAVDEERVVAEAFRREHPDAEHPYYEQLSAYPRTVAELVPPPADHFRREVSVEGLPTRGDDGAAEVRIVECVDFDCDACEVAQTTLTKIAPEFGDRIAIYFLNYPLPIHPNAEAAHRAAVAAGNQGKFWEMHDFLFDNRERRLPAELSAVAGELGLDVQRFEKDFAAEKTAKRIASDYETCRALGVRGAPGFLINGRLASGALPAEQLRQVLTEELNGGFEAAGPARR
ncbi:DSBA-like thioredoxin domain protein [Enhygromyxa salina]|uniref:DSBA-like thioredoxin domain protein n=1 Tax=Enhygromyxa salina TaxID=215803 RepID=A0A2S9XJ79_9BACT|nr:thioredoxin domain-containing protein [Enhygromyxa salina]PRP92790.1 DSBA-like thioredoxin domain protein [Enhygromyxa salina]